MSQASRRGFVAFLALVFVALVSASSGEAFNDGFDTDGTLQEAGSITLSSSADWWLSSGAYFYKKAGLGMTVQGNLPDNDPWRLEYLSTNPLDTDDGYHPQNIFRYVARGSWKNFTQQAYFRIQANELSGSPNRNASNGLFFFNRYQDANNIYYTGIRVDGAAVIKKKLAGTYYTVGYKKIYAGTYNVSSNPNLLPMGKWVGMKTVISDNGSSGVDIEIDLDDPSLGTGWTPVLSATDTGANFGAVIANAGHAGIRTDFMDVQFDNYSAVEDCSPTLSPASQTFSSTGGTGSVTVSVASGCSWSATSSASWITANSGTSGIGNGSVGYAVAANTTSGSRIGTLSIGGQTVTITEGGTSCAYSISPASASFASAGGLASVAVTAATGCGWSAASSAGWIGILSGGTGSGNGTVAYSVSKNSVRRSRTGMMTIAGKTFTVSEAGR